MNSHMRASVKLTTTLLLFAFLLAASIPCSQAQTIESARNVTHEAYKALAEAYQTGANITELINQLNHALELIAQAENITNANPDEAQRLVLEAQTQANNVIEQTKLSKEQGIQQGQIATTILIVLVIMLVLSGVLIYVFGQKIIWKIWLRLRYNYRVRTKNVSTPSKDLIITSKKVCALILGALIVVALFAVALTYFPSWGGEQFSELGILGPSMKLGDYPSQIVAGETITLYAYIGNHMGKPIHYIFMVKLGDNSTSVNPAPIEPIQQYEKIVNNNQTVTFPITLTFAEAASNQRIIFELWTYNETLNQNQYHQRWGQLWINITAPAK